jgi:hypothetical protein
MGKVKINWTTTTTERFSIDIEESKLPENWRELLDNPSDDTHALLAPHEYHYDESLGSDPEVLSRVAEYVVLDQADFAALEQALEVPHTATFVPSTKYPDLFTVVCSCGSSSFGAMTRESGESAHTRHAEDPAGGHFRDPVATKKLIDLQTSARKASS